ncbi:MAG: hypothetical protein IIV99_06180 [Oscillospiraceae bacterium]|nr:hypothetical protein [Oscillospiraceae bacterium]
MFPDSIFSLIVVLLLAFSLYKLLKINPSVTPFVSVMTIVAFVSLASLVDLLNPSIWAVYILSAVLFALAAKKSDNMKQDLLDFFTPGVIMFAVGCIFLFCVLAASQPLMGEWDEYSFWGTAQKLTKHYGQIYTYYDSSLIGKTTSPALCVLAVFFQPFGTGYLEWKAFFGYDVMFLASFCAWTGAFKKKNWHQSFFVFLTGFMTPFVFIVFSRVSNIIRAYISVMADIPLGIVFAGAMAVYFFAKDCDWQENSLCPAGKNCGSHLLCLVPVLVTFTMMKDMGFAFSLIIIMIVFFDLVLTQDNFVFVRIKGFWGKIAGCMVLGIATVGTFMAWTIHMAKVLKANRFELGGAENLGMAEMLIVGVKELLSPEKSQKFLDMTAEMTAALTGVKVSMFGNGIVTLGVITLLFAAAVVLTKGKKNVIRVISLYITGFIGFVAYYVFHLFLYVYIFKDNAYGLPSYHRYMYPYYLGFMAFGIFALVLAIRNARFEKLSRLSLAAVAMAVLFFFNTMVSYETTFLIYNYQQESVRTNVDENWQTISDAVEDDHIVYCYANAYDAGDRWFKYTFLTAPTVIVREVYFDAKDMDTQQFRTTWRSTFLEYVEKAGITHLLVDYPDEDLLAMFGDELGNDIMQYGLYGVGYYEITAVDSAKDYIEFRLVKEGKVPMR